MASSPPSTKPKKQKQKQKHSLEELKNRGIQLLSSWAHINNLLFLLPYVNTASPPQYALESILSLQSFFTPLLPQLPSSSKASVVAESEKDPEIIRDTWLRSKFDELVKSLIDVVLSPQCEGALREIVLDTLMEFVKVGNGGRFNSAIYHKLLRGAVHSTDPADTLLELLASKYFQYIDVRYFTYISLEKLVKTLEAKESSDNKATADDDNKNNSKASMELSIKKIHYVISHIPPVESGDQSVDYEMWSKSESKENGPGKQSKLPKAEDKKPKEPNDNALTASKIVKRMKPKFSKSWISFLRLQLPLDIYKEVLATLHQAVIPYMSSPTVLCDFLTRSYDIGGVVSVMALSSLFILMTQHGLEYPNFYDKLYGLLEPSIFMAKHRAKFFQLLDSCLKSPLIPAHMAASFAKKMSRLAVSVPPSGALIIIALIHNLLRRHPSINCLVHREDDDETENDGSNIENKHTDGGVHDSGNGTDASCKHSGIDYFNSEESNPMKTKAIRSSLWEIDTLRHHYCPPVSRFVSSLEEDLTVRAKTTEVNIDDFSSASYATIFGDEIRRRVKQVPLAFYRTTPTSLFTDSDFAGWTFKYTEDKDNDGETKNEEQSEDTSPAKRQRVEC